MPFHFMLTLAVRAGPHWSALDIHDHLGVPFDLRGNSDHRAALHNVPGFSADENLVCADGRSKKNTWAPSERHL